MGRFAIMIQVRWLTLTSDCATFTTLQPLAKNCLGIRLFGNYLLPRWQSQFANPWLNTDPAYGPPTNYFPFAIRSFGCSAISNIGDESLHFPFCLSPEQLWCCGDCLQMTTALNVPASSLLQLSSPLPLSR